MEDNIFLYKKIGELKKYNGYKAGKVLK